MRTQGTELGACVTRDPARAAAEKTRATIAAGTDRQALRLRYTRRAPLRPAESTQHSPRVHALKGPAS